jgi:hypothetical protein
VGVSERACQRGGVVVWVEVGGLWCCREPDQALYEESEVGGRRVPCASLIGHLDVCLAGQTDQPSLTTLKVFSGHLAEHHQLPTLILYIGCFAHSYLPPNGEDPVLDPRSKYNTLSREVI